MRKIIFTILSISILSAQVCSYQDKSINELCQKLLKKDISMEYIDEFLLSNEFNSDDKLTLKMISKKRIKYHKAQEKKANNTLKKYIPKIVRNLNKYKTIYDLAEQKYNVNREIIAGILMKETRLGNYKPKHDALQTLGTVYRNISPDTKRNKWLHNLAKSNLISLISYCNKHNLKFEECKFKSSYIGAIGYAQFMPNSFKYIVPYQKDYSLLDNMPDAILSIANYLHIRGKYNKLFDFEGLEEFRDTEDRWYEFASKYDNASFSFTGKNNKYRCYSCNKKRLKELSLIIKDIMKYNNSSNYAMGVFGLAYDSHFYDKTSPIGIIKNGKKFINHKVQKGETLFLIGLRYNLKYTTIMKANNLKNSSLRLGQILKIPKL
jgi:membrane-bound lytic murein transglycosylase B